MSLEHIMLNDITQRQIFMFSTVEAKKVNLRGLEK
jgi:hypothetical protein